ncbi:efflux RND transporter periplasmic adaptor subunit [bacterium]|nr:efflux RND transporter periplasmic adaptor subunit [bacterium]
MTRPAFPTRTSRHRPRGRRPAAGAWVLAGLLAVAGCGDEAATGKQGGALVPAVEAVRAREGNLPLTQRLSGVVEARNQIDVHPEINAVVTEVLVSDGATVAAGDPLVRLRATEFEKRLVQARADHRIAVAQRRRAEAQAKEARADYERLRSLAAEDLASTAELEAGEARAESAEAEIELAGARVDQALAVVEEEEENLGRTVVRAPIAGAVGNRGVEPGMLAGPSTRLLTLGQLDSVRVEVILTDRMLADVAEGQRTEILLGDRAVAAPLARISPFLNPVSHTARAEIDLANPDGRLKPGMFVAVDVYTGESETATLVPLSAVYEHPTLGVTGVYAATGAVADAPAAGPEAAAYLSPPVAFRFVPVEIVAEGRMEAAVRPLAAGDWVVSLGQNLLGGEEGRARVRPVDWSRVERLQSLQREDLMRELNARREGTGSGADH